VRLRARVFGFCFTIEAALVRHLVIRSSTFAANWVALEDSRNFLGVGGI